MTVPEVKGISYIIPAYNEENSIVTTIERLRVALVQTGRPFEIIVVNDGSSDATKERAQTCSGARVFSHPVNTGYGSAIKTGIANARYHWIGIVDADGTYDIEQLPQLVQQMDKGFDLVIAARRNITDLDRPLKRAVRWLLIAFLNIVVGKKIADPNSGFRLFSKSLAMTFFPFLCNTFSFTTSLTVFALGEGYFVCYVPTEYSGRTGRTKVRHIRDSLRMAQLVLQGITYFNPLKFYILLVAIGIFMLGLPAMVIALLGFLTFSLYFLIVGVTLLILFGMGVLGDIIRISNTVRVTNPRQTLTAWEGKDEAQ